jgi:hypothetical protein
LSKILTGGPGAGIEAFCAFFGAGISGLLIFLPTEGGFE